MAAGGPVRPPRSWRRSLLPVQRGGPFAEGISRSMLRRHPADPRRIARRRSFPHCSDGGHCAGARRASVAMLRRMDIVARTARLTGALERGGRPCADAWRCNASASEQRASQRPSFSAMSPRRALRQIPGRREHVGHAAEGAAERIHRELTMPPKGTGAPGLTTLLAFDPCQAQAARSPLDETCARPRPGCSACFS